MYNIKFFSHQLIFFSLYLSLTKGDLIREFGPGAPKQNLVPLLEVFIALPEEKLSRQLKLGQIRRDYLERYFKSQVPCIIHLMHIIIGSEAIHNENTHLKALRCLGSWFNIHTMDWAHLTNTCVISDMINIVKNPQISSRLHEIGTDCICSAMIMLEEEQIPALASVLFAGVLQLEEAFHMAVALEDLTAVTNYARMFAELGETLVEVIVDQRGQNPNTGQVLHLLLTCVGHHEWEVAEITFNFWYKLSEVLYKKNDNELNEAFSPHVERLIEALYRHCQIDSDHEGILMEQDDFFEFRERVQELIKDVSFICGSKHIFQQMSHLLQTPETMKHWNYMEAALFIMQSIAKSLLPEENEYVPPVMDGVLSQPETVHVQVAYTSLQLLGELNEWLASHPTLLPQVLTFLIKKLQGNRDLATVAAKALDAVCHSCRDHIEDHFDGLMTVAGSLDSFSVSNDAVVGLLKGVSSILGRLPREKIQVHMKNLCSVQEKKPVVKNDETDPVIWLDRLSAIFRSVNPTIQNGEIHPCQEVVMEIWPTLAATFQQYSSDIRIMEHCCRCLRFAVRCVHQQSAPLLPALVEMIVNQYAKTGFSCFVYLGSILVDEYASEEGCVSGLLNMLQAFMQPTFALLTQPNGFKEHPDTVDDWFRLCTRNQNNTAVLKFFQDLIDAGIKKVDDPTYETRRHLVTNILDAHGQTLVNNLVTAAIFILPSYMVQDVAETFYQLMMFDRPKFCVWLEVKLKDLPRKNSGGIEAITNTQIVELHKTITKATKPREISRALNEFTRYYT
ncbi:Transportin-3 [Armadillidium nasatum]|uniref:Transportin-3 n=1 Tax=Armadillidium nasatum TaxID=96803 RepID=A0A5N5T922_9CRUS|nr:Transportin-3 [Armadillidium nasatum]